MSVTGRRNGSRPIRIVFVVLAALIGVLAAAAASGAATFQPLGLGPAGGVQSFAWDVSADGSVAVGTSWVQDGAFFPPHAVRWALCDPRRARTTVTPGNGMETTGCNQAKNVGLPNLLKTG